MKTHAKPVLRERAISLPLKLGAVVALSVFLIEVVLMLLPHSSRLGVWDAPFDAGLLTLLVSPILYVSLLRPLAAEVTAQKQAEAALLASGLQLQAAQRLAGIGSWSWDVATDAFTWSKELYAIYGVDPKLPPPGLAERRVSYTPESWSVLNQAVERAVRTGEPYELELEIIRRDGEHRWHLAMGAAVRDQEGQICGLHGTVQDIEEKTRVRDELALSQQWLWLHVEQTPLAVIEFDVEGQVRKWNPAATAVFGHSREEAIGKDWTFVVPAAFHKQLEGVWAALVGQRGGNRSTNENITKDGRTISCEWFNTTLVGPSGSTIGVASLIQDVTARKEAEEALHRRLAELEALHTVSAALRSAKTRDEALPILLEETLAALDTDTGAIWLYHPKGDELRLAIARGWFQSLPLTSMGPAEGIAGAVFGGRQMHVSAELARDPLIHQSAMGRIPAGWGGVCLPIRIREITIGVLLVAVPPGRPATPEQARLLESLSEMGGTALHRMALHEETVRQLDQLKAIRRVDQAISSGTNLRVTLGVLLEHIVSQLHVDAADVLLLNPHTLTLATAAGCGFRAHVVETVPIRLGEGLAGRAALWCRTLSATSPAQLPESPQLLALQAVEGFVAHQAIPLVAKGQVVGVLQVFNRTPLPVGPDWADLVAILTDQTAIAIENAQLFEGMQRSNFDLALAYDATIEGWSHALDLRDKETQGHTQRVTEMTMRLARAMGVSDAELVHVRRGALLHDIGKLGVPDDILLKPGPLSEEEWAIMRRHPQMAYDLLAPITYLYSALDIPRYHHEKWDGTGYPRGFEGEAIPLAARLFAVVDVWDALCSDRPYRKAWPEEKALEHIRDSAGTHFDPKVVKVFLDLVGGTGKGQAAD